MKLSRDESHIIDKYCKYLIKYDLIQGVYIYILI